MINVQTYMTPREAARAKAEAAAQDEQLQRDLLARTNREEGRAEPRDGDKLIVATAKGLKVRGRAGLAFSPSPAEVKVADVSDEEIKERQLTGEYVVNLHGAEQILADSNGDESKGQHRGLILFSTLQESRAATLDAASEEDLEAALAERKAKRAAKRDGAPERIKSGKKDDDGGKTPADPKGENNATTKPPKEAPKG